MSSRRPSKTPRSASSAPPDQPPPPDDLPEHNADLARRHITIGWLALAFFMVTGLALEFLHAMKADLYLHQANEVRHLMWRLGHTHGTLFSLISVVYGLTLRQPNLPARPIMSRALLAALVLVPAGFFGGGAIIHQGDPGLLILLVPPGALLAILAALRLGLDSRRR